MSVDCVPLTCVGEMDNAEASPLVVPLRRAIAMPALSRETHIEPSVESMAQRIETHANAVGTD